MDLHSFSITDNLRCGYTRFLKTKGASFLAYMFVWMVEIVGVGSIEKSETRGKGSMGPEL